MKTIQELIRIVQDRISLPLDDDDRWSTIAVVNAFNDALDDRLTPDLVAQFNNHLVHRSVFALNQYPLKSIPIPNRAVSRAIREVKYLPSGLISTEDEINCLAITLDEKDVYAKDPAFYNSNVPYVFMENDYLRFIGGDTSGSIVIYYSLEPSTLQNTVGQYSVISNISGSTVDVESETASWVEYFPNTVGAAKYVDIFRKSTGAILKPDVKLTRVNATQYTINNLTADEIDQIKLNQEGQFVDTAYDKELVILPRAKSEFSTIPYEYDQLLTLYVCERILESLGDNEGLQITTAKTKETLQSIERISANRFQGEVAKLNDRRTVANALPRTIQSVLLDLYDAIPQNVGDDARFTTEALIRAFNSELIDRLGPHIVSEGSNFLTHREVIQLSSNGLPVFPLNAVPIPKRAIGRSLREVKYLPAGKTKIEEELNCPAISLEEKDMFSTESELYGSSVPYIFFENDSLRLVGGDLKGALVMYYNLAPSTLENVSNKYVTITDCQETASIGAVTTATNTTLYTGNVITPASLNILPGMAISGPGIPPNTYVVSTTDTSIIMSNPATETNLGVTVTVQVNAFITNLASNWGLVQPNNSSTFVDVYCKTSGAILKPNVKVRRIDNVVGPVTRHVLVFDNLSQDEFRQIQTYQSGGFPIAAPYESELLLLPAGKSEFLTIPEEYDQLLVLFVAQRIMETMGDANTIPIILRKIQELKDSIGQVTGNRLPGERRKLTDRRSIARIQRGRKWSRSYIKNYT